MRPEDTCLFFLADLHALSQPVVPSQLAANTIEMAAALIACGIDPNRSILFKPGPGFPRTVNSHGSWAVRGADGLAATHDPVEGQSGQKRRQARAPGCSTIPCFKPPTSSYTARPHVPVGDDQKQHLELARDIAAKFNADFQIDLFPLPDPFISQAAPRIMSLRDGRIKMSKSDPSDMSRINLTDSDDTIVQKLRKARTDTELLPDNAAAIADRTEAHNLITLYAALSKSSVDARVGAIRRARFWRVQSQPWRIWRFRDCAPIRQSLVRLRGRSGRCRRCAGKGRLEGGLDRVADPSLPPSKRLVFSCEFHGREVRPGYLIFRARPKIELNDFSSL